MLNSIHDIQTVITCTGLDEFVRNRFQIDKIFEVISGTVSEKNEMLGTEFTDIDISDKKGNIISVGSHGGTAVFSVFFLGGLSAGAGDL